MPATRIVVPAKARKGEVIEIKTLINHVMETGFRRDNVGKAIPRDIISRFVCTYNGDEVFRAELFPAIAANPSTNSAPSAAKPPANPPAAPARGSVVTSTPNRSR